MTYLSKNRSADMDVSIHFYTGFSSGAFTYATPTNMGAGVTRPSSTQFTLAQGRHYLLLGGFAIARAGTFTSFTDVTGQWHDGTSYVGKKASIRLTIGDPTLTPTYIPIKRNPTYRDEAAVFIRSSDISGSLTLTLNRLSVVDNNNGNFTYSIGTYNPTQPAVVIMSIPA